MFSVSTSAGPDTIADAAPGDVIRLSGATLTGTVTVGNGAGLGQGQVQMEVINGNTVLHIGTNSTPGSDGDVILNGVYDAGQFTLSGSDILVGPAPNTPTVAIQAAPVSHDEGNGTTTYTFTVTHSGGPATLTWSVAGAPVRPTPTPARPRPTRCGSNARPRPTALRPS